MSGVPISHSSAPPAVQKWWNTFCPLTAAILLVFMIFFASCCWNIFVTDTLYHCTDAIGLDFILPGNWVHGSIAYVPNVLVYQKMGMGGPDTIKQGWSKFSLLILWFSHVAAAIIASTLISIYGPRLMRRLMRIDMEQTC